jgi:asparagine synthase (glutamine-hydrolysing)
MQDARRMLAAAPHRGSAVDLRCCGNAVVGVSNCLDEADSALSTRGELVAALSGRLDNAPELAHELTQAGFAPASNSGADILVSAFRAYGVEAPNRFRGVFAGIVTDGRQMWSFRDHVGFQPLFYTHASRDFCVATEVKQVIAGAQLQREPDTDVLERIFYGRLRQDSPSAFKGVNRLPHGMTLTVNGNGISATRPYWYPRRLLETGRFSSLQEVKERFDERFEQAVSRCLTGSDVVSLSGGVDSPAVAGYAAPLYQQRTGRPLPALSLVFPDHPKVDERPYIESITRFLGMDLHTCVSKAKNLDNLSEWCQVLDGPVPSVNAPQMREFYLEARRLGYRNILTGDISECVVDLPLHVAGHLLVRGRWLALARHLENQRQNGRAFRTGSNWRKFAAQLLMPFVPGSIANWYLVARNLDFAKRIPDWLDARVVREHPFRNDLVPPGWARWSALQTMPVTGCPITMEGVEIIAAQSGVTIRRPFADIDLWEFFLSLPAEIKYPDHRSKTLLRGLVRGKVPDEIVDRRDKTYFDDHMMSQIDYTVLKGFLSKPDYRVRGVDYERLALRLEARSLTLIEWIWIIDLVRVHAFMKQW